MLTKNQYKILDMLVEIKKHNSNHKNMPLKFQSERYNKDDVAFLHEQKMIKMHLAGDLRITEAGEKELKERY